MIIYPAVDLMAGQCVRLRQGDFDDRTSYSSDPAAALRGFADAGAEWAHIVDLDGAKAGKPVQHDLIATLAAHAPLKLQVAGGFRAADQVARMLDAGVGRVVIGSLALKDPEATRALFDRFGSERITLALDVSIIDGQPIVAGHGWTESSGRTLADVLSDYPDAMHLLVTDIARDGMLTGPNVALIGQLARDYPGQQVQASGGVAQLSDIPELVAAGAAGAVIGKAIWEGRFTVEEAVTNGCA